jgi:hypothetical protein
MRHSRGDGGDGGDGGGTVEASRASKCAVDIVDGGHLPAVASYIDGLRPRPAANGERPAGRQSVRAVDERGEHLGDLIAVPRREADEVHQAVGQ